VTEILKENGFELVNTTLFSDEYASQTEFTFSPDHQAFSFLHRSFIFKRVEKKKEPEPEEVKEEAEEVVIPTVEEAVEGKKKIVKKIKVAIDLPEPVFFFSGNPALNADKEFSNMFDAAMQIDGLTFATVEHYFQWSKAKMFGDEEMAGKIMKTPSSKSVKGFGKKVKNFDKDKWEEKKNDIMRIALKAKFSQHPELRKKLQDTGTRPIAEADPRDKYWGIGTSFDTSKAKDPTKWPGKNVLGTMLQDLRTELKE
jgi:ribA/ribD-fused uncharacterized protein